jgi:hypothetical protein
MCAVASFRFFSLGSGFPFAWLEDHLDADAALFRRGVFELTPAFLPSLALDIFHQRIRPVCLSATLESQTDFIRAFGRLPDVTIAPSNDTGNGEHLVINGCKIRGGFGPKFATELVKERKAVVAVPDYKRAKNWSSLLVDGYGYACYDWRLLT